MIDLQHWLKIHKGDEGRAVLSFMAANPNVRPSAIARYLEELSCRS